MKYVKHSTSGQIIEIEEYQFREFRQPAWSEVSVDGYLEYLKINEPGVVTEQPEDTLEEDIQY